MTYSNKRIALLLPCLNEELTLAKVIRDFKREIPHLEVYVFDNRSTDRSKEIAKAEGAIVISVPERGKGNVVRKMFDCVDADLYIMVDSDDTYDASGVHALIKPVLNDEADMMVGNRLADYSSGSFRKFHRLGNALIIKLINVIFGSKLVDICSGYRVMSNRFVKNIPLLRQGFEVETELTVYSLIYGFRIGEVTLPYRHRPPNSFSKLRTFSDGYKVLLTIVWLARDLRPLLFFASAALLLSLFVTLPLCLFSSTSQLGILISSLTSIGLAMTGLILNTLHVRFQEIHLLTQRNQLASERQRNLPSTKTTSLRASQPLRDIPDQTNATSSSSLRYALEK